MSNRGYSVCLSGLSSFVCGCLGSEEWFRVIRLKIGIVDLGFRKFFYEFFEFVCY